MGRWKLLRDVYLTRELTLDLQTYTSTHSHSQKLILYISFDSSSPLPVWKRKVESLVYIHFNHVLTRSAIRSWLCPCIRIYCTCVAALSSDSTLCSYVWTYTKSITNNIVIKMNQALPIPSPPPPPPPPLDPPPFSHRWGTKEPGVTYNIIMTSS